MIGRRLVWLAVLGSCGGGDPATRVMMDFDRPGGLYDAPFPSDDLRAGDQLDVAVFPNPEEVAIVEQARGLLSANRGYATTAGVFFQITDRVDETSLPDLLGSVAADSPVALIGIDPDAPDYGQRYPVEVSFQEYPGLYAAPNTLALVPLQGVPLRPLTRYAAVVTTGVVDAAGRPLAAARSSELSGMADTVDRLAELGIGAGDIAGLTVFTTGDPTAELARVAQAALERPLPTPDSAFSRTDLFDDFCVYQTTIEMPDYQSGTPPYRTEGGNWTFESDGTPIFQRAASARLVVTVPRTALPQAGYPLVVFVRTGGGGDRPLVDRGRRDADGLAIEPGEGPARYLARAGFAGMQIDGPLGGLRNPTGGDEQFLIFNVQNLRALRDNVRQSAVELVVLAHVAADLELDASDCPPAGTSDPGPAAAGFDSDHLALMGHSMGATIAPLVVGVEPLYRALLLSGAGGSWIENIVYKRRPLEVAPVVGLLIHQPGDIRTNDPVLSLTQWALEPADPPVYAERAARLRSEPLHVLMMQGIVDTYILPRIANATSLSLGLDLGGPAHDTADDPRLADQLPVGPLLPLVGRGPVELPASLNAGDSTRVVTQHLEDGVEDGHEVMFQTEAPKHQYQCFLASWLAGAPAVPTAGAIDAPCN